MLRRPAVLPTQLRVALADDKTLRIDEKEMRLGSHARRPAFQGLALPAQLLDFVGRQQWVVADPHVHVALVSLGKGPKAAHQKDAVNRLGGIHPAWFVGERPRQTLRFGKGLGVRLVMGNASGGGARHIAWQQRMINVEKQRQQG